MRNPYEGGENHSRKPAAQHLSPRGIKSHLGDGKIKLERLAPDVDDIDTSSTYKEEDAVNNIGNWSTSSGTEDETTVVIWKRDDPQNPYNWSSRKKKWIVFISMITITNSTLGSSLPSNAVPYIAAEFGVVSSPQKVLPISVYIIGYVMGPLVWAPLSEQYGRRDLTFSTFFIFAIFTMACALSPTWPAFLVFRLVTGIFASAPMAIVAGIFADIFGDPRSRGRGMAMFMVTTVFGPLLAPIVSGFCAESIGWRWTFWIATILAGVTIVPLLTLPETYGPILLQRRAIRMRKADPKARVIANHEVERPDLKTLATVVLTRPIRMLIFEPIVSLSSAYLSLIYGLFYMSFSAYPLIFQTIYGLSPGVSGLVYMVIGAGAILTIPQFFWWDHFLLRVQDRYSWTRHEEYRRLPLACVGGPLFAMSLFWLGWTARADISFAVPMVSGLFFGMGWMLIFMALLNYLTDSYDVFAASANAAASFTRSIVAVVLPLATTPMFARLGIAGACSLLGGLSILFSVVPFLFIWYGERIRASSRFCIYLKQRKEDLNRKVEEEHQKTLASEKALQSTQGAAILNE